MCLGGSSSKMAGRNGMDQECVVVNYDANLLDKLLVSIHDGLLKTKGAAPPTQEAPTPDTSSSSGEGCSGAVVAPLPQQEEDAPTAEGSALQPDLLGKTKLCKFWSRGQCERGQKCSFAHGRTELRSKPKLFRTELCFDFGTTGCRYGDMCKFAHDDKEIRNLDTPQVWNKHRKSQKHAGEDRNLHHKVEEMKHETKSLGAHGQALEKAAPKPSVPDDAVRISHQTTEHSAASGVSRSPNVESPRTAEELKDGSSEVGGGAITEVDAKPALEKAAPKPSFRKSFVRISHQFTEHSPASSASRSPTASSPRTEEELKDGSSEAGWGATAEGDANDDSYVIDTAFVVKNATFSLVPIKGPISKRRARSVIRNRKEKESLWAASSGGSGSSDENSEAGDTQLKSE